MTAAFASADLEAAHETARLMLAHHNQAVYSGEDLYASEADIRGKIKELLVEAGLTLDGDVRLEAGRADLRTGQLIIEVKRRIGEGTNPKNSHLDQLDGYLDTARDKGDPERLGLLCDGKFWALRPSSETGKEFNAASDRVFTLHSEHDVEDWRIWLRDKTEAFSEDRRIPSQSTVRNAFNTSVTAQNEIAELRRLFDENVERPTVTVKRDLWRDLLGVALGEVVEDAQELDSLFVRHTYLAAVTAFALHSAFGLDINGIADSDPHRLVDGSAFASQTGVEGVIESDFFGWVTEASGGGNWIKNVASRVASFDWAGATEDVGSLLYESVISAEERKNLGEYYTPSWLAEAVVAEVVDDPLNQRVLDPACGSGAFLKAAIGTHLAAAQNAGLSPAAALESLQQRVIGIDIHPVAVHLARAAWVLAAKDIIRQAANQVEFTVPVYLGDSLQLRSAADSGTLFGQDRVSIHATSNEDGEKDLVLEFPLSLVEQSDYFDSLMRQVASDISFGLDPAATLDNQNITGEADREVLLKTFRKLKQLHDDGRNHIWAYYTRNLVRPVWLASPAGQADRIVGNPPWLTYNKTVSSLRVALKQHSRDTYGIWPKPQFAT